MTLPRDKKKSSYELISTLEPRTGNHILHSNWEDRPNILPAQDRAPERAVLTMAATHRPRPHMSLCQSWVVRKHQQHERRGQCFPKYMLGQSPSPRSSGLPSGRGIVTLRHTHTHAHTCVSLERGLMRGKDVFRGTLRQMTCCPAPLSREWPTALGLIPSRDALCVFFKRVKETLVN